MMKHTLDDVITLIKDQFDRLHNGPIQLDMNKAIADQGYDSLDILEIIMEIEKHLNITIKDTDIHFKITPRDIVDLCMVELDYEPI
jgi:acyl carrier protein